MHVSVDIGDSSDIDADVSPDESSSSSSSDSSEDESAAVPASTSGLICLGRFRAVTHAMVASSATQSNIATWQGNPIQTACGVRFASNRIHLSDVSSKVNNLTFVSIGPVARLWPRSYEPILGQKKVHLQLAQLKSIDTGKYLCKIAPGTG